MNVDAILISEYATLTDNNQALTVLRCFNAVTSRELPARVPSMAISVVIHAHFDERGTKHEFKLKLLNERREQVGIQEGVFQLPQGGEEPTGIPLRHTIISRFGNVVLSEAGPHAFELYIDGTYHAAAAFNVELVHGQR